MQKIMFAAVVAGALLILAVMIWLIVPGEKDEPAKRAIPSRIVANKEYVDKHYLLKSTTGTVIEVNPYEWTSARVDEPFGSYKWAATERDFKERSRTEELWNQKSK
jgi:hypothetical protein